jgi:HPt (histidine-containing phosphotransfer) domain-containing protein
MLTKIVRGLACLSILFGFASTAIAEGSAASTPPPGCTSCKIQIDNLDKPVKLSGKWLFSRDDLPENKNVDLDTSGWRLVKAPGPWKGVYDDKKVFPVGWYRGNLEFAPALVGQEAVLLVNAYMSRISVYIDGEMVYSRPNNINVERYYSIQAIPVRFKIKERQVIAIRIDTPLMSGIYQLPLELRKYDKHDASLVAYQILGGESRIIAAYVIAFFGLFFLLIYSKTHYSLYLVCAASSLVIFPFFAAPGDYFLSIFEPETLLYLHYVGISACFLFYVFAQFFHKFTPKINWIGGTLLGGMGLIIGSMAFYPNVELFQNIRSAYFIGNLLAGFGACYMLTRGIMNKKPGAGIMLFGLVIFVATGFNDVLLALGVIQSYSMIFLGVLIATGAMLYVASNTFANTFVENKRLVADLKVMNDSLEDLVSERTLQLRQKTNDIASMLENMPQGVLTVTAGNIIHPEYSAYLESIFETKEIAGKNLMDIVFTKTSLGADMLSQVAAAIGACIGEDQMNFEFNSHLLVSELDKTMADGRVKSLELSWSPICTDLVEKVMLCVRDVTEFKRLAGEATAQKRELEIIGEILAVSQEKFQEFIDSSYKFVEENDTINRNTPQKDIDAIGLLFRNMHTLKGNARTYGLLHMTNVVHETEQVYDELRKNPEKEWDFDSQKEQLAQVRALVDEYDKVNSTTLGRKGPECRGSIEHFLMVDKEQVSESLHLIENTNADSLAALRATLAHVGKTLNLIGTERVDEILSGVIESIPSLARELGKEPPRISIDDHGIVVRNQISGLLKNLFVHLFRNSMDHGLETPAERLAAGKPPVGQIQLGLSLEEGLFTLRLRDDGRGLNMARLRQTGIEKDLLTDPNASPESVAQLIFTPSFSTAEKVTEVSGRGVGMDAVKGFLEREGGEVSVQFLDNNAAKDFRPFEIVINLPAKFAVQLTA